MCMYIYIYIYIYIWHMYAEFHSCGISSPANISSNMSARKIITFVTLYLSISVGIPPGLGTSLL
jgi:hypothetical protein